jgi:flavodoxin
MKTLIAFYTFGGETRREAIRIAAETEGAVLCEIREKRNRSVIGSFFGCTKAMRHKPSKIKPVGENFTDYDRIIIGAPIWADYPAPAWNAIVDLLPPGKEVELFFCSMSGGSGKSKQSNIEMVEKKGCKVVSYRDVLTGKGIVKEKRQN